MEAETELPPQNQVVDRPFKLAPLSKRLSKIAGNHGVRLKSNAIQEALQSAPSENAIDLIKDICAPMQLNYAVHALNKLRDLEYCNDFLIVTEDNNILYGRYKNKKTISCESFSDNEIQKIDFVELKNRFKNADIITFSPSDEPIKNVAQRLKLLNPLYGFGSGNFLWVAIASLFSNILGLATSLFIMVVYDRVLPNQASETLYALAIGVGVAVFFDQLLKMARSNIIEYTATAKDQHISNELFEQFVDTRVRNSKSVGSLTTIVRDFETYKDFVTSATILALIDLPFIFVFIYVIYVVGGQLYLVPLVCIPIVVVSVLIIQPLLYRSSKRLSDANKSRQGYLVELLTGLDVLRVNGAFAELRKRFVRESRTFSKASARAKNLGQVSGNIVYVVQQFSQVAVIVYGFHLFINQDITMGAIIATMILSGKTLAPLAKLSQTLAKLNSAIIARKNLQEFLKQRRKNVIGEESAFDVSSQEGIQVDNVTLRLADGAKPLFSQLSINVPRGQKLAVIGKSGSGKTTLIRLLCGLNEPEVGTAFVDGNDVTSIDRADVFKKIGVCFQDPWVFAGTIRENIALGHEDIDDDQIVLALKLAGGDALGSDLHAVLEGACLDRGSNLSGGQKQIITLARSFVFSPAFLLLDEPTSSMDAAMESQVIRNIKENFQDRTVVLVTHKPNLLNACDRILVLEGGKVAWDGSREQYVKLLNERKAAS